MSLDDDLKNLPKSIRDVDNPDEQFKKRKKFMNEEILPPLMKIQKACEKSEPIFYLQLPYPRMPVSLRNFPTAITLVWEKLVLPTAEEWRYCISVCLSFPKKYVAIKVGNRDFDIVLMDEDFNNRYEVALSRSLQAIQSPEFRACKVGLVSWQRFYDTKL